MNDLVQELEKHPKNLANAVPPESKHRLTSPPDKANVPSIVHEVLDSPGQGLNADTRVAFERPMNFDFSQVKIHTGERAAASAAAVQAKAYTAGNHIVLGDRFRPSQAGDNGKLLTHELVHVMQWQNRPVPEQLAIGAKDSSVERQASSDDGFGPQAMVQTTALQRVPEGQQSRIQWENISRLATGMVVRVEVRAGGNVQDVTHEYPLDVNGDIKMPLLGLVRASGLTMDQLADQIQTALQGGYIISPTVNVTLVRKIVAYGALISYPRVHLRLLNQSGTVETGSGEYPVREDGTLNLPYVGVVTARNRRLDVVESEIQTAIRQGYINNGIVHLTRQHLA